jgi:uncharacterized membrane protein
LAKPSEIKKNVENGAELGAILGGIGGTIGLRIGAAIGAGYGAITSFMKVSIKPDAFKPREIPDKLKDFAYLYHAKEQLRR